MTDRRLARHHFTFNPGDNGGEALYLVTEMFSNGDKGPNNVYWNQQLCLESYQNSAQIRLHGIAITPELLRELANQLDEAAIRAGAENS